MSDLPALAAIIPEGAVATPLGLDFSPTCTEDDYAAVMFALLDVDEFAANDLRMYIGDGLNYGDLRWHDTYVQYVNATGHRVELLRDFKWVYGAIPKPLRQKGLRYGHYKAAAALSTLNERKAWLIAAAKEGWTTDELRSLIKVAKATSGGGPLAPPEDTSVLLLEEPPKGLSIKSVRARLEAVLAAVRAQNWPTVAALLETLADDLGP
jgi:hypothetical protein